MATTSPPPASSIARRQNEDWSITQPAAQRRLYTEMKGWRRIRAQMTIAATILGLAAAAAAGSIAPDWLRWVGACAALVSIAQWFIGSFMEKQRAKVAATIQEQFDTYVLQLEWNSLLARRVDPEDIIAASGRLREPRDKLRDWYSIPVGIPYPLDVLLCQRTNLRWDSTLRKQYAGQILLRVCVVAAVLLIVGFWRASSPIDIIFFLLPATGGFLAAAETVNSHRRHATDQVDAQRRLETLWEKATSNPRAVKSKDLRQLQDRIFGLRIMAPPVSDGFYQKRREAHEFEMREGTRRLWEEAKVARRIP